MAGTRRRKTDLYAPLCESFARNVNNILNNPAKGSRRISNKTIATITCASETTVGHWLNGEALPTVDQLYKLAGFLHVSIDFLLSKKADPGLFEYEKLTYWDAFLLMFNMVKQGAADSLAIQDYFLSYLVTEALRIDANENLSENKRTVWFNKVNKDFSVPLFKQDFLKMYLEPAKEVFAEISDYDTVVSCLKGLHAWDKLINDPVKDYVSDNTDDDIGYEEFSLQPFYDWARKYKEK